MIVRLVRWLLVVAALLTAPVTAEAVITLVQQAEGTNIDANTVTATFSSTPTQNNLLLACYASNNDVTPTNPSGWSTAVTATNGVNVDHVRIAYKIAGAGESTGVTFTSQAQAGAGLILGIFEFSGIDTGTPLDVVNAGSVVFDATSVSTGQTSMPTVSVGLAFACMYARANISSPSMDSGFTVQQDILASAAFPIEMVNGTRVFEQQVAQGTTFSWTTATGAIAGIATFRADDIPTDEEPPTDPTNLIYNLVTSSAVTASWGASTDNLVTPTYEFEQSTTGCAGSFSQVATPSTNSTTITGLSAATAYCFRVRATDGPNTSGYATGSQTTTRSYLTRTLNWTDNSPDGSSSTDEDGFTIQRCEGVDCDDYADYDSVGQNVTTYQDTSAPNPAAGYRVRATSSAAGDSTYSNEAHYEFSAAKRLRGWRR